MYALYKKLDYAQKPQFEDDLKKWRDDRNYLAHHSNPIDLEYRGNVVKNAQYLHGCLIKLIADLKNESDSDLDRLADDAMQEFKIRFHLSNENTIPLLCPCHKLQ